MGRRFLGWQSLLVSLVVLMSGCAGRGPYLQEFKVEPPVQACSIAVLPLVNKSSFKQGETIVYRLLFAELVNQRPWRIALEGDVRKIYREMQLRPWVRPTPSQMQIIASRLGADLLICGEILEMEERVQGAQVTPRLKMRLQVFSGKDGIMQWATYHNRLGTDYRKIMHFGLSNTVSQLGKKMIKEILTLWEEEGLMACSS